MRRERASNKERLMVVDKLDESVSAMSNESSWLRIYPFHMVGFTDPTKEVKLAVNYVRQTSIENCKCGSTHPNWLII